MLIREAIDTDISFADSEYKELEFLENDILNVYLNSWDDRVIKISFIESIQFTFKLGDYVSDLFRCIGASAILEDALTRYYEDTPDEIPFTLFQLLDIYDFPFIEVVAKDVKIVKI